MQVVPTLGVIDTTAMLVGHVSVKTTLFAADVPLFVTVMLYVVFCPTKIALATLVVTPISATLGLIGIAPWAQLNVALVVAVPACASATPPVFGQVRVVAVEAVQVKVPLLPALVKPAMVKLSPAKPLPVPPVIVP